MCDFIVFLLYKGMVLVKDGSWRRIEDFFLLSEHKESKLLLQLELLKLTVVFYVTCGVHLLSKQVDETAIKQLTIKSIVSFTIAKCMLYCAVLCSDDENMDDHTEDDEDGIHDDDDSGSCEL